MRSAKPYAVALVTLFVLDATWIGLIAGPLFKSELGALMRAQPVFWAAAVFYLIYAGSLTLFAIVPSLEDRSVRGAAVRGAALGLAAYGTFDLTNLAILQGWTALVTFVDLAWGTFLTATVAAVAQRICRVGRAA